ncbi:hypothetical protein [Amycolatopsis sp. NPDC004378]
MSTPTNPDTPSALERRVCDAAVRAWHVAGEESRLIAWASLAEQLGRSVTGTALGSVVLVPRLRRVECVFTADEHWDVARQALLVLADQGWAVNALVPLHTLGAAHEVFRGLPVRLQGWWERDDRDMAFTEPEVA